MPASEALAPNILIVDDDPTLLSLLGILLREEGYRVVAANSAEQALAKLAAAKPDLLITDLRMSGMDGMALFEAARRKFPLLPVIILTAHGTIPEAVQATRQGAQGFLTKPYEAKALLQEIQDVLSRSAALADPGGTKPESQIVSSSPVMQAVLDEAAVVAPTDASILILGQTGTGKELLAQTIHDRSRRRDAPFVPVNCGAIPEALLESELFGHVKGAFTGAVRDHAGLFQAAEGGTLFLDEIGDMPAPLQVKLLRVLQQREVRPVGSTHSVRIDVRLISATHRDLLQEIAAGRFREDLYYRLNVVSLKLPALADRREDIPLLARHFFEALSASYGKTLNGFAPEAIDALLRADWPGNVRQLFNVVEKCVALSTTPIVPRALVERALNRPGEDLASFEDARREFESDYLIRLLKICGGNVSQAARIAKRNRSDFYSLLSRNNIDLAAFKRG
ncbi:MAG: sigma 54-interacting transcriptional regulator [Betaproteobacteria bacterium]|nr:sigma 54-interacting transcriptional regulator [Betaproteobacteria bacterium]